MKTVILLTNSYPFGVGETYLEPEMKYFPSDARLVILPIHAEGASALRFVPEKATVLPLPTLKSGIGIKISSLFSPVFFHGAVELRRARKLSMETVKELLRFVYSGKILKQRASRVLKQNCITLDRNATLYSYWMDSAALAAVLLKRNGAAAICRAHGADLYDERTPWGHQFLREYLVTHLDHVFPVSEMGAAYLTQRVGGIGAIQCVHLGVEDHGLAPHIDDGILRVVSCSVVIPLKRLDIIVNALAELKDVPFLWTHIGDGSELEKIRVLAEEKLPNGSFRFFGAISNEEVHQFYQRESVDVFVNASDTEGIPVSIMEAMSYGIPSIATNVGGVKELVRDGYNGYLIDRNRQDQLAFCLRMIQSQMQLRIEARISFLSAWDASKNLIEL